MHSENKPLKTTHMHISSCVKISVCLLLLILTIHYTVLHACVSVAYQRLPFTRPWIWGFTFLLSFWSVLLFLFVCLFVFCLVCVLFFRFLFFLILDFINSKRQCNHAIKRHGHISWWVVKKDQFMTLNKLHKLQR